MKKCVFSVDVEDWFHILDLPSTPSVEDWDRLPSRVERDFGILLQMFAAGNMRVTCFFLGWIAERYPHLVAQALAGGHEIASHGYAHKLVYELTAEQFYADAYKARVLLEDLAGRRVSGYRASGFSITRSTPWFFDSLARAGYSYDSSVFPASRGHGGLAGGRFAPYTVLTPHGELQEFPITITEVLNKPLCLFGGGYLRLAPWALIKRRVLHVLEEGRPVVFYLHPREIDPDQPRLSMSRFRSFKSYVNISRTEAKVKKIISSFEFLPFEDLLAEPETMVRGAS